MLEKKEERKKHLIIFDERGIRKWHKGKLCAGSGQSWEKEMGGRNKK
jgi:hypothetical protein